MVVMIKSVELVMEKKLRKVELEKVDGEILITKRH